MDQAWILANVPGVQELLKDLDRKTKETTPLGPYREQRRYLSHERVARFTGEALVPTVDEVLARIDREETSLVSVESLAADLRRQQQEAQEIWGEFKSLGSTAAGAASAEAEVSTLAVPATAFGEQRARMLAASPLAQLLQAKGGLNLGSLLALNPAEEGCRVGFKERRLTDGRSYVERRMEELLQNRNAWRDYRAIKDGSVSELPASADDRGERFAPLERLAPMLKAPSYDVFAGEPAAPRPQPAPSPSVARSPGEARSACGEEAEVAESGSKRPAPASEASEEAIEQAYQEARGAGFGKGLKTGFFNTPRSQKEEEAMTVPSMADLLAQLDFEDENEGTDAPDDDRQPSHAGALGETKAFSCEWSASSDVDAVPTFDDLLARLDQEDAEDA